ncbi:MAG: hypothetical protein U1F77_12465 [Kiritimatiellia bacterium]
MSARRPGRAGLRGILFCLAIGLAAGGCATTKIGPTTLKPAPAQIPEEQLLDVGVKILEPGKVRPKDEKKRGEAQEIREAEANFMPVHLRQTMEASSHYGNVRVMPLDMEGLDVQVTGEIVTSNGEELELSVEVKDATGTVWFQKNYREIADADHYTGTQIGRKDAFQDLYNSVANDIADYKSALTPQELRRIRDASRMRFAASFAPDTYGGHIKVDDGEVEILRLPAENDPQMKRILDMREREYMFFDTVDTHYQSLYLRMWAPYESWRKSGLVELLAMREIERDAFHQKILGGLMIAAAILLEMSGAEDVSTIEEVLVVGGVQVVINGFNVSAQTEIHAASLKELSESFKNEAKPVVMEVQGKVVELRGTTEEQYARWREILRKIYEAETGRKAATPPAAGTPAPAKP